MKEKYTQDLSSHEAIKLGLSIFKEVQGDEFSLDKFDIGIVEEGKIKKLHGKEFEN